MTRPMCWPPPGRLAWNACWRPAGTWSRRWPASMLAQALGIDTAVGVHPHLAHGVTDGGPRIAGVPGTRPGGRRHRRDGPRLRPGVLAPGRPAGQPALAHRARLHGAQAAHPPLPLRARAARRPGRPGAGARRGGCRWAGLARAFRRASRGGAALVLGAGRLRGGVPVDGLCREHLRPRVPGRGGGDRRGGPAGARRPPAGGDRFAVPVAARARRVVATSHAGWRSRPAGWPSSARSTPTSWATTWCAPTT